MENERYDLSSMLAQFPVPPFHIPPTEMIHNIPTHLRQKMTWSASKTNPLQDLPGDSEFEFDEQPPPPQQQQQQQHSQKEAPPRIDSDRSMKDSLAPPQLPQLGGGGNWRISVASSLLGGNEDGMNPSNEIVNRLTRASIISSTTRPNPRASILMPITPRALLGREVPPLPVDRVDRQRAPSPEQPRDVAVEQRQPLQRLHGPQGQNVARGVRENGAKAIVPPALQQFRMQREEEEQRQLLRMTSANGGEGRRDGGDEDVLGGWARDPEKPSGDELLRRAILSPGILPNQANLYQYLKTLSSIELGKLQRKVHATALREDPIRVDRYIVDFKKNPIKVGVPATETLTLVSKSNEARFRFVTEPIADPRVQLTIDPSSGTLNMQGLMLELVNFTLTVRSPVDVNIVVILEVDGGHRHYLLVRPLTDVTQTYPEEPPGTTANPTSPTPSYSLYTPQQQQQPSLSIHDLSPEATSPFTDMSTPSTAAPTPTNNVAKMSPSAPPRNRSTAPTGVNVMETDLVDDMIISGFPHRVPRELALLRASLMAREGLGIERIFSEKGDDSEIQNIRNRLKQGLQIGAADPYAVASCIKLFFRDSQHPLLAEIPAYLIMGAYDEETAWQALGELSQRSFE
ncbi:hypothetical protein HDU67_002019 [Dinochytrium kinnereticum]|nr:hypothetical protein HDU67_002019 [Dinochytrium kinnereticum]